MMQDGKGSEEMMGPLEACKKVFWVDLLNAKGRSSRAEFWWSYPITCAFILFSQFVIEVAIGVDVVILEERQEISIPPVATWGPFVLWIIGAFFIIPGSICVSIRRLHDMGRTGLWIFLGFVPVLLGMIIFTVMCCWPSQKETNKWGPPPEIAKTELSDEQTP